VVYCEKNDSTATPPDDITIVELCTVELCIAELCMDAPCFVTTVTTSERLHLN